MSLKFLIALTTFYEESFSLHVVCAMTIIQLLRVCGLDIQSQGRVLSVLCTPV